MAAQALAALALMREVSDGATLVYAVGNWAAPFGILLVADRLSAWMLVITALLALFALLHAARGTDAAGRYFHVLFQWQLLGLNGAFLTGDLFNLFVFFEILLIASYALLLHGGGRGSEPAPGCTSWWSTCWAPACSCSRWGPSTGCSAPSTWRTWR